MNFVGKILLTILFVTLIGFILKIIFEFLIDLFYD